MDIISSESLFSSLDKYESGIGWPIFTRPLESNNIVTKTDWSLLILRVEVKSKYANFHVGHVFKDGPTTHNDGAAADGLRYCLNSVALRFVPVADWEKEGYGQYVSLFE